MAHSKQARKRVRTIEKKRVHNKGISARMRTEVKRVIVAAESGDFEAAKAALPIAMKHIDKAAKTNILSKNAASNRKSMMARAINRAAASNS